MLAETYPIRVLLMTFSGLVNRHQADIIAYLVEEYRVLKEQMGGESKRTSRTVSHSVQIGHPVVSTANSLSSGRIGPGVVARPMSMFASRQEWGPSETRTRVWRDDRSHSRVPGPGEPPPEARAVAARAGLGGALR